MMTVDPGIYYLFIVILAASLVANVILAGYAKRCWHYYQQYYGLWKEAITRIDPCNPYEKQQRSIQYEYIEGLE